MKINNKLTSESNKWNYTQILLVAYSNYICITIERSRFQLGSNISYWLSRKSTQFFDYFTIIYSLDQLFSATLMILVQTLSTTIEFLDIKVMVFHHISLSG